MPLPETRYAKAVDDVHIAYQVLGNGVFDLVVCPGFVTHVEYGWEEPRMAAFLTRLASFSRLIVFDKRGTGLSDPVPIADPPTLEVYASDIAAVMDAAGSRRAALLGLAEGTTVVMLYAASFPTRTSALVLFNAFAQPTLSPSFAEARDRDWGKGRGFDVIAPSVALDQEFLKWAGRFERLAASPGTAAVMRRLFSSVDLRPILPTLRTPTLVLHRAGDRVVGIEHGRYLATHIAGASFVELPGDDHLFQTGDIDAPLDEIEEFLTGVRRGPDVDRVLTTIMFTDIVASTKEATRLGDRRWRDLLDRYDSMVDRQLTRFRGRQVKTTGDGTLAMFDGPARAIQCATAIRDAVRALGLRIRVGVHTGEVDLRGQDIAGLAVVVAHRVSAIAQADEVLASRTVVDLVTGSGIAFEHRGDYDLKGVPGKWQLSLATST